MRRSSMVPVGTNHQCDPLLLLGPPVEITQEAGFPLTLPHSLWGGRWEPEEGAGAAQLQHLPSLEQGCRQSPAHPCSWPYSADRDQASHPQAWVVRGLLRSWVSPDGGLSFPSAFCTYWRKEQVISTLCPGLFSIALWALSPSGNQLSHVPFLFHYAKQGFNQKVCCFILDSFQGKKKKKITQTIARSSCHSRDRYASNIRSDLNNNIQKTWIMCNYSKQTYKWKWFHLKNSGGGTFYCKLV